MSHDTHMQSHLPTMLHHQPVTHGPGTTCWLVLISAILARFDLETKVTKYQIQQSLVLISAIPGRFDVEIQVT